MIEKIEGISARLNKAPMMHGDFQLDPILRQDLLNLLKELTLFEGDGEGLLTLEQYLDAHNIHTEEPENFRLFFEGEVKIDLKAQQALSYSIKDQELKQSDKNYLTIKNEFDDRIQEAVKAERERIILGKKKGISQL